MDKIYLLMAVNGGVLTALSLCAYFIFSPEMDGSGQLVGGFRAVAMKLSPGGSTSALQRKLDLAGNPGRWGIERVMAGKTVLGIVLALFGVFIGYRSSGSLSGMALLIGAGFMVFGFFLPDLLVSVMGSRRQEQIQKDISDVLDLMSVSMRAGLGFDAAVARVANNSNGPLAMEFARMLQEFRLGQSRADVLRGLASRSSVPDLHHVVQALVQADGLGVPVADVLTAQSKEMRVKRRQRAEERAQKVTIKILFPVLFCIFPALFVVVIGPAAIKIVEMFTGGIV